MKQFVSCEGLPDIPPSLPPPPSVFALFHNFSTTNSQQLNTKQPFWFLKLNVSDEVIVGPLGHDALFTLTPSPPPSLSRSLTGLQLISPNTRHSPQSQDQLFAGMFCTKVFMLRYQHQQKPVFYHQTQCCQYLSAARVSRSQLVRIMWLQGAANTNNPISGIWGNKWSDSFDILKKRKLGTCIECGECEIELKYIFWTRVQDGVWS